VDGYHKHSDVLEAQQTAGVKGRPETLDIASFVEDVRRLKRHAAGEAPVGLPLYDRPSHNPKPNALLIPPPPAFPLIVIEGILLFTEGYGFEPLYADSPSHAPLLDATFYLDLPEPIARERVNGRKVAGGRRHEAVEAHYLLVDQRNHHDMDRGKRNAQCVLRPDPADGNSYAFD
jgi:pantothenate kinase